MSHVEIGSLSRRDLRDRTARGFVEEVADLMKVEVIQALSARVDPARFALRPGTLRVGARPREYPSVGKVVNDWVARLPDPKRAVVLKNFRSPRHLTPELRAKVQAYGLDLRRSRYVLEQDHVLERFKTRFMTLYPTTLDRRLNLTLAEHLGRIRVPITIFDPGDGQDGEGDGDEGDRIVTNSGLRFRLHRVRCIDETDPEWFGSDEIHIGGVAVDHLENTTNIPEFDAGSYDEGDQRTYNPPRVLKVFDLSGGEYPKTFAVFLTLAEKDAGGFGEFLREMYEAIKAEVTIILTALGAAAGAAIGAAIGGSLGTALGGPIGTIIGVVAGLILGALVAWLADVARDDIFEPQVSTVTLPSADATFQGGSLQSPLMTFLFADHGGEYSLSYTWELTR